MINVRVACSAGAKNCVKLETKKVITNNIKIKVDSTSAIVFILVPIIEDATINIITIVYYMLDVLVTTRYISLQ